MGRESARPKHRREHGSVFGVEAAAGRGDLGAELQLPAQAEATAAAGRAPADDDALARAGEVDSLADRLDDPAAFMPQQPGVVVAHPAVPGVEVGVADAAGEEPEPNLAGPGVVDGDLLQAGWRAGLPRDDALRFDRCHSSSC